VGKGTAMTAENLIYKDVEELGEFGAEEKKALAVVLEELRAWDRHDLQKLYSLCDKDIVYHDITLPPAKGLEGMKAFAEGWVKASPDFTVYVEQFVVQGTTVVNVGRISGTMTGEYFGAPGPGKPFDCMYCQVAIVENGKLKYIRDHWDSYTMMQQLGWGLSDKANRAKRVTALVEEDIAAVNAGDVDRLCRCYTDDVVFVDASDADHPVAGMAAFREAMAGLFATFPDLRVDLESVIVAEDGKSVVATYGLSGTMKGKMGEKRATGKKFHLPATSVYLVSGGRFAKETLYWDTASLNRQLAQA